MTSQIPNTSVVTPYENMTGNRTVDLSCLMLYDPPQVQVSQKTYLFASLTFIAVGLVGNTLSIMVFSSRDMRVVSSNVYLLALSFSDSLYLVSVLLDKTFHTLKCFYLPSHTYNPTSSSDVWCLALQYLQDLFSNYSTCLILAFTLERYIAVYLPVKFKAICTVQRARLCCVVTLLFIGCFIAPHHVMYIQYYPQYSVCTINHQHEEMFTILYVTEMILFRIVPVFVIVTLNILIIVKVSKVTVETNRRLNSQRSAGSRSRQKRGRRAREADRSLQLTLVLILVSTSYVLVFIPVLVTFVLLKLQRAELLHIEEYTLLTVKNYTSSLYISGFAINFFLYTVSGRVFREQLVMITCGSKPALPRDFAMSAAACVSRNGYTGMPALPDTDIPDRPHSQNGVSNGDTINPVTQDAEVYGQSEPGFSRVC